MSYKKLALKALLVNSSNDRHGELENETAAIAWLFTHHESAMRKLAKDLAETGEIYEPPLVWPSGTNFIVFDGNRRVTCLKLISQPKRAPSLELQAFFKGLNNNWYGTFPDRLECQIETDRERIDEILLRRHTGTRGGVGRNPWTDRMTATFVERTGKGGGVNVADEIEKRLDAAAMLPAKKIPWSTANRLLSSEGLRNRVGISVSRGKFRLTHPEPLVLPIIRRIVEDLTNRTVVLGDLWDNEGKIGYLDRLETEGLLPLPPLSSQSSSGQIPPAAGHGGLSGLSIRPRASSHSTTSTVAPHSTAAPNGSVAVAKLVKRSSLIPQVTHAVVWQAHVQRHKQIWDELQFKLKLDDHANAISVLFRVLFELSIDNYISRAKLVNVSPNDSLKNKVKKVGADLEAKRRIDGKYAGVIRKLESADGIFSIDTMNRYVHSPDFAPSPSHLTALWDQVSQLVVICLNS
ncbi:hypothetical protein GGE43_005325 [Agrobacterium tumefaciens]|uniref:ParB/Sulfiredoxin domain-containing protein n=1 Tax=Agrobacterium radiobacter TaxID=362 RepID=A0ABR6JF07_AGRRD|nr:hypothetical protein [Agrobacterium radiobacter]MBB4321553.1 hypothetical protein [Agrobacterium radiobacter]MBB4338593.1 hypothetical protein [Agrobacterium radiobacter]MBB4493481.1 hypothetical protein [Agrobacterium radiobacter]MBB4498752.1 hypothetical protein [Agrobacterium radiobacter]MBB4503781.1 hypothetical protein [Agrobacterium radiobacter]